MNRASDLQKAILNNVPDQAWLKDEKSRYVLVNEAFISACGLSENAILNKTPAEVWPEEWGQKYIETDKEVMQTGIRKRYEEIRMGEDGSPKWFDTIKTPIQNKNGKVIGTAGISRDITDRKKAEQELEKLNRLYAVRSKVNQSIVRITEQEQLFQSVCKIAVKSGGLALAWIGRFLDDEQAQVQSTACFTDSLKVGRKGMQKLDSHFDPEFAQMKDKSFKRFVCNNTSTAKRMLPHAKSAQQAGFSSFAVFPLDQLNIRAGIFVLYASEPNFFTKDILQLLQAISKDLSFALEFIAQAEHKLKIEQELLESRGQLRELSAYLQSVREEERTRIARELHDELGQSLTAIRIGLSVIEKKREMKQDDWHKNLQSLKHIAETTVESVQRISSDLRPLILDELGLASAADWLLESFTEHTGIKHEISFPSTELGYSKEISTGIFRILQESMTNIGRHSHATKVTVELKEDKNIVLLRITDNGKGIDLTSSTRERSFGLIGMRERAFMLGGKLLIQSGLGLGTTIELQVPKTIPSTCQMTRK